jgi:serine protease Do
MWTAVWLWAALGSAAPGASVANGDSPSAPPRPTLVEQALAPSRPAYCTGDYADDFAALSTKARAYDDRPDKQYTYCVRTTAVYECLSYGPDGNLRRTRRTAEAHGTAFAYRKQGGDTLLLTNDHVAEWPTVTDADHEVDDVPRGCKRVSDSLKIVDDESDAYARDDIPLQRVVVDPQLDMAVLRSHAKLKVMPWRLGRSAALRERNVVQVRGFPLGAFKATSVGKVISAFDHDDDRDWNHDDFVIDAMLSPGNSGSPVFAISCRTGELELVGVYHAGYTGGSALNVVVGIDQIRDLMFSLKRTPRPHGSDAQALDAKSRAELARLAAQTPEPFFPFGNLTAAVRPRADGSLLFELMPKDFPLQTTPLLVLEDLPPKHPTDFGELGRAWFGSAQGLLPYERSALDGDTQAQLQHVLDGMRHDALAAFHYAQAARTGDASRKQFDEMSRRERAVKRAMGARRELAQSVDDLAERLVPKAHRQVVKLSDVLASPPSKAPAASQPE